MGNYFSDGIIPAPFYADEDLTTQQYRLVMMASTAGNVRQYDNVATGGGSGSPAPVGVLQNDPSAAQEATVKVIGFTKAIAKVTTCYLSPGVYLRAGCEGALEAASVSDDQDDYFVGRWFGAVEQTEGTSVIGNVLLLQHMPTSASLLTSGAAAV